MWRLIILLLLGCTADKDVPVPEPPVSQVLTLTDIDSKELFERIERYKDKKAVLVNFWATWCAPCVEEFPHLLALEKKYAKEMEFLYVSFDFPEAREAALDFLEKMKVTGEAFFKNEDDQPFLAAMPEHWSGGLPFTMLFDVSGTRTATGEGGQSLEQFEIFIKHTLSSTSPSEKEEES